MDDTRDEVGEILAGMTGGRTGTAGGVSSPVPPAADWARGLDAASASAARLTVLLSDVYRAHQGKDPSASLAAQIEQTVRNLTGEPPQEPEYGPGLWTAMPQRSWETMGMARPIDWTGAPSRTEIDLMTMHAIRYGEWLCRTFPTWEQTLPACWIEHDDVVAEVFALKCHADLAAASPNGGMYMPALMQDIHQALARVKEYLTAAGTGESSHAHHGRRTACLAPTRPGGRIRVVVSPARRMEDGTGVHRPLAGRRGFRLLHAPCLRDASLARLA